MIEIKVYNKDIEGAIQALKRKVKTSGLLVELQKREYYKKPSQKRRERKLRGILREKYRVMESEELGGF